MADAFISYSSAIFQNIYGSFGKAASIFFDRIIIQVPKADFLEKILDRQVEDKEFSLEVADNLKQIWIPVHKILPEYQFLDNPWENEDKNLIEIAADVTIENTKAGDEKIDVNHPGFRHEVAWAGAGLIDAVAVWNCVHSISPCTILPDSREQNVIERLFGLIQPSEDVTLFSEITENEIPDFAAYQWEKVVDLRNSQFLENFRKKLSELLYLVQKSDNKSALEILREIELKDLRELAKSVKPSTKSTIIKSILSNLPLPIPVNPVSVGVGYKDVKDSFDRKDRFGWLYFLMHLKEEGPNLKG